MVERKILAREGRILMDELEADELAKILGGLAYVTDENVWVVIINRDDGREVILSAGSVDEYADWEAFKAGHCYASIKIS